MNEELLRQWATAHGTLINAVLLAVVVLVSVVQLRRMLRAQPLGAAVAEFKESLAAEPSSSADEGRPMTPRFKRNAVVGLLVACAVFVAGGVSMSWDEFQWLGAVEAPAKLVSTRTIGGMLEARYEVQPPDNPSFIATLSFAPGRGSRPEAMENSAAYVHVIDVLTDPLRYRIHERSSGKTAHGWDYIKLVMGMALGFGGFCLIAALRLAFWRLPTVS